MSMTIYLAESVVTGRMDNLISAHTTEEGARRACQRNRESSTTSLEPLVWDEDGNGSTRSGYWLYSVSAVEVIHD